MGLEEEIMAKFPTWPLDKKNNPWKLCLTETKAPPLLQSSLGACPSQVKSSFEQEQVELVKVPKFKARSLHEKIFL